jgi:hypothetical protein
MRKTLAITVAGMLFAASLSTSAYADPSVAGTITQTHSGTALTCIQVNGQWYGVENIYPTQAMQELLAASDGATLTFELYDPPRPIQCHGTQPAFLIHDLDRAY